MRVTLDDIIWFTILFHASANAFHSLCVYSEQEMIKVNAQVFYHTVHRKKTDGPYCFVETVAAVTMLAPEEHDGQVYKLCAVHYN